MSENNLKIRGKFINKLSSKIEDLNNNFILLSKVDKKILKKINNQISENINNQKGGDSNPANNAILAALKKSMEMKAQQESLNSSLTKLQDIKKVIDEFTTTFDNIKGIIDQIQVNAVDLKPLENLNGLQTLNNNTLTNAEINALTRYLTQVPQKNPESLDALKNDPIVRDFKDKIDLSGFNILFGNSTPLPAAVRAAPASAAAAAARAAPASAAPLSAAPASAAPLSATPVSPRPAAAAAARGAATARGAAVAGNNP
jgi:hypothetical protein